MESTDWRTFVPTPNVQEFNDLCQELMDPDGFLGVTLSAVVGVAGLGKTWAAKRLAARTPAVYVFCTSLWSPLDLLREIVFYLTAVRPRYTRQCLEIIEGEMSKERRVILIDEADKLPLKHIEALRWLNERTTAPVVFIGEEGLKNKISSERRLIDRTRRFLEFRPVDQVVLVAYYQKALDVSLGPEAAALLYKRCGGNFRKLANEALAMRRALKASGSQEITEKIVKKVLGKAA